MRRRFAQLAIVLVLTVYICGPVFEHFDRWDHFPQSGPDIVVTLAAIALCFAVGVYFARVVVQHLSAAATCNVVARSEAELPGSPPRSSHLDVLIPPLISLRI
jgi:hypothetical protein